MAVNVFPDSYAGPIIQCATVKKTTVASGSFPAANDILLAPANPNRLGFVVYNNSTNTMYVLISTGGPTGNQIGQCATNAGPTAHFYMTGPMVYTGAIYGYRNSGSGSAWIIEFEK